MGVIVGRRLVRLWKKTPVEADGSELAAPPPPAMPPPSVAIVVVTCDQQK
jgi:hypothetical protein